MKKKSTTHTFNVVNINEYHQSQGGGSVHADFSLLGQKWAESGYCCLSSIFVEAEKKVSVVIKYIGCVQKISFRTTFNITIAISHQSINQSMAVTDAGTKVPLCPYHTFYTLLYSNST